MKMDRRKFLYGSAAVGLSASAAQHGLGADAAVNAVASHSAASIPAAIVSA